MASQDYRFSERVYSQFDKLETYITDNLLPHDAALEATLKANAAANLDAIDVAPNEGKFLYLLAKLNKSKNILEVGTLGGYSAIWFAKAVGPSGKVTTLEIEPFHAEIARKNIEAAGFKDVVDVKVGPALDTLKAISEQTTKPVFDFVFIDADKVNNLPYFKYALQFSRAGTAIVVDNVARRGRLVGSDAEDAVGTRALFEWIRSEEESGRRRVESTALQTVGSKGWDGFLMATVVA